jgi:hypothetical protein
MGFVLQSIAACVAFGPAIAALSGEIGVPPQQGLLFALTELGLTLIAVGIAFQNRFNIWLLSAPRLSKMLAAACAVTAFGLILYLFAYNQCVIEHPLYQSKLLFPFRSSGKLSVMIERTGSRYAAVDKYGLAAVFDAISEDPAGYALALATLLTLYAVPLALGSSVIFVLGLRYPSPLFRPSATFEQVFDVFLCYNRADMMAVRAIAQGLALHRIKFFLDEQQNPAGQVWTERVSLALSKASAFAVCLGAAGIGKWQAIEIQNIAEARLARACNVVPVFLPDAPASAKMPMQLAGLTWVDFRSADPNPMTALIRGLRAPLDNSQGGPTH